MRPKCGAREKADTTQMPMIRDMIRQAWNTAADLVRSGQDWARRHLPPGVRLLAGLLLMAGGVFAFLPVLGMWMFPLGVAIAALDVVPLYRWVIGARRYLPAAWRKPRSGRGGDD